MKFQGSVLVSLNVPRNILRERLRSQGIVLEDRDVEVGVFTLSLCPGPASWVRVKIGIGIWNRTVR